MIKCDKCGKFISELARQERFIDGHGRVDLCIDCENKLTKLLDKVETEWFGKTEGDDGKC